MGNLFGMGWCTHVQSVMTLSQTGHEIFLSKFVFSTVCHGATFTTINVTFGPQPRGMTLYQSAKLHNVWADSSVGRHRLQWQNKEIRRRKETQWGLRSSASNYIGQTDCSVLCLNNEKILNDTWFIWHIKYLYCMWFAVPRNCVFWFIAFGHHVCLHTFLGKSFIFVSKLTVPSTKDECSVEVLS